MTGTPRIQKGCTSFKGGKIARLVVDTDKMEVQAEPMEICSALGHMARSGARLHEHAMDAFMTCRMNESALAREGGVATPGGDRSARFGIFARFHVRAT